jgi:hypothetical protein
MEELQNSGERERRRRLGVEGVVVGPQQWAYRRTRFMTVSFDFRPPPKALKTKYGKIGVWSLQENWTKSI